MPHITVVLNRKGGVGKSLVTVNLAAVYAEILGETEETENPSVAVVSIDPQATSIEHADAVRRAGRPVPFRVINASGNADNLRLLRRGKARIIIVDTPGFMPLNGEDDDDPSIDPLGDGTVGDSLRAVLDVADDVIVPLPAAGAAFNPTRTTVERVLIPRQLPYGVVINDWDPRDSAADMERTRKLAEARKWELYNTTVRHYKPHTRGIIRGQFCTQYDSNHTSTKAKSDFSALALEHQLRAQKWGAN